MDKKNLLVKLCEYSGISRAMGWTLNNVTLRGPIVRAVNYHGTPKVFRDNLIRHFEYYASSFRVLSEGEIFQFLSEELPIEKVGLVITFDDGLRSNYLVAAQLLDEFGISGMFFLPAGFIELASASCENQRRFYFGESENIDAKNVDKETYEPMSWNDVKDLLARGHGIGSHTLTHTSLGRGIEKGRMEREIVESKTLLEDRLNTKVVSFCWPEGQLQDYSKAAYDLVRQHYLLGFTTFGRPLTRRGNPFGIDRANVESHLCLPRVRAATNGLTELYFYSRGRKFDALIAEQ